MHAALIPAALALVAAALALVAVAASASSLAASALAASALAASALAAAALAASALAAAALAAVALAAARRPWCFRAGAATSPSPAVGGSTSLPVFRRHARAGEDRVKTRAAPREEPSRASHPRTAPLGIVGVLSRCINYHVCRRYCIVLLYSTDVKPRCLYTFDPSERRLAAPTPLLTHPFSRAVSAQGSHVEDTL